MLVILLLAVYVGTSALGMVLIRKGGGQSVFSVDQSRLSISITAGFIVGICLYLVSFVVWMYILQMFPLTYISPVAYGMVYVVIAVFSYFILGESITREQAMGAIFIIIGILISSVKTL